PFHLTQHSGAAGRGVRDGGPSGRGQRFGEARGVVPREPADPAGRVDGDVAVGDPASEDVDEEVGQVRAALVAGEMVDADQIDDLGLGAGLLADIADRGLDWALAVSDLATGQTPESVSLALLTQQNAAA